MTTEFLSQFELRRYSLQVDLPSVGKKGQEKLKKSKVLVIGSGGKGVMAMQSLVTAGIGKIGIADNDLVEEQDLTKQTLYGNTDIGKQKAIVAKQKLLEINSYSEIGLHNICISADNIDKICVDYDIIIDATDNTSSHYLISDSAVRLNLPVVYGATNPPVIEVSVFNFKSGPSYRSIYPEPLKKEKTRDLTGLTANGILCSVTGIIMANEALKVILEFENTLSGKLLKFDLRNYSLIVDEIGRESKKIPKQ